MHLALSLTAFEIVLIIVCLLLSGALGGTVLFFRRRALAQTLAFEAREALAVAGRDSAVADLDTAWSRLQEGAAETRTRDASFEKLLAAEAEQRSQNGQLRERLQASEARLQRSEGAHAEAAQQNTALMQKAVKLQTALEAERSKAQEKLEVLQGARESLQSEFKNLANEIFEDKKTAFKRENHEQVETLLKPLGERIKDFEKRVEDTYNTERRERHSLIQEVQNLQGLNARISEDAVNLTNALKGEYKTQGTWGEVILERILEKSGLSRGREYEVQVSLRNEDGRRRQPDVLVHLPEGKDVIVDSKVSLASYERYCSAEVPDVAAKAIKAHVLALRTHIKRLSEKEYQQVPNLRSLDFVLMFVPIEAAFTLAVQEDNEIFSDAFEHNIVIVSPSTLLATLRTIQNIWRYEHQNRNAQEIARRAGALYDKFVNFVKDLEEVGRRIGAVQNAYDKAHNKLASGRGSLVRRAESMRELGAEVSKSLPQNLIEFAPGKSEGERKKEQEEPPPASSLFD